MAIKAVFFDIDGTFLNDRKRVSSSTKKAISQMIWVWILQSLIMVNIF